MNPAHPFRSVLLLGLVALGGCQAANSLLYQPKPEDRLDGFEGSLKATGANVAMDWGPQQTLLLDEFKTLKEEYTRMERRLQDVLAENNNLKTRLGDEADVTKREKALRAQAEALAELEQQKRREHEATILGLRIEKAKLEQMNLYAKIESLKQSLDQAAPTHVEAAATPPARK